MDPLVSIIIPVYNRLEIFEHAIDSAINQTYNHIEIIVVDDGSDEPIEKLVEEKKKNSRFPIYYLRQANSGPGVARNHGLKNASGMYIQYLDADDSIFPEKIKRQVQILEQYPNKAACLCCWESLDVRTGHKKAVKITRMPTDLLESALNARPWPTSSPLWHYSDNFLPLWPNLIGGEDIVHDVSVGIHQREIIWMEDVLAQITSSSESLSMKSRSDHRRMQRLKDNFDFPVLCHSLLEQSGLIHNKKYAEPLAERCYRIGFQFAVVGEREPALKLMDLSYKTSQQLQKRAEIIIAVILINATNSKCPKVYRGLFKIHRLITSQELNARKNINSLVGFKG